MTKDQKVTNEETDQAYAFFAQLGETSISHEAYEIAERIGKVKFYKLFCLSTLIPEFGTTCDKWIDGEPKVREVLEKAFGELPYAEPDAHTLFSGIDYLKMADLMEENPDLFRKAPKIFKAIVIVSRDDIKAKRLSDGSFYGVAIDYLREINEFASYVVFGY